MYHKNNCLHYATSIGYDMIVHIPLHHAMYSHTSCLLQTGLKRWQRIWHGFDLHISTLLPDFCNALPRSWTSEYGGTTGVRMMKLLISCSKEGGGEGDFNRHDFDDRSASLQDSALPS